MEVEILSWRDLKRRAVRGFAPETALISLGDWGSEPLGLVRSPAHPADSVQRHHPGPGRSQQPQGHVPAVFPGAGRAGGPVRL